MNLNKMTFEVQMLHKNAKEERNKEKKNECCKTYIIVNSTGFIKHHAKITITLQLQDRHLLKVSKYLNLPAIIGIRVCFNSFYSLFLSLLNLM